MERKYTADDIKKLSKKMGKCPFCNSDKSKITSISKGSSQGSYYQGLCNKCYARGPKTSDPYTALEKWNTLYLGDYVPDYDLNKSQLKRLLDGESVIRCDTQMKFNVLISKLKRKTINICEDIWYLWGRYRENTVVCVDKNADEDLIFGYSDTEYFESQDSTIEDLIVK